MASLQNGSFGFLPSGQMDLTTHHHYPVNKAEVHHYSSGEHRKIRSGDGVYVCGVQRGQ